MAIEVPAKQINGAAAELVVVVPVYNDWRSLKLLLDRIDQALDEANEPVHVVVIDDGSIQSETLPARSYIDGGIRAIDIVRLRRNVGHQRAIAIGLAFVAEQLNPPLVAVMDGDGEDDPADLPRLVARCRAEGLRKVVFAARGQRSESPLFRIFYAFYKLLFLALIGRPIRFGNFSVVPRIRLTSLVAAWELWNHYAAAVIKSRQPFVAEVVRRGRRLDGRSRMNFVDLVIHGLSAVSVFSEVVGVRLLIASLTLMGASAAGIIITVSVRLFTNRAIPGWASNVVGSLMILLVQAAMLSGLFVFMALGSRSTMGLTPRDHYDRFIRQVERIGTISA